MAGASLVLCNPLCFLINKLGKSAVKSLKSAVLDFYSIEELSDAKKQLLRDVTDPKLALIVPHVPERRDGEFRAARIVDDIFTVLTFLDESLNLKLLPKYVAGGPDSMPSTRLYEGDLAIVMSLLDKMGARFSEFDEKLAAIMSDMHARSTLTEDRCNRRDNQAGPARAVIVNNRETADRTADRTDHIDDEQPLQPVIRSGADWATVAASSPIAVSNRFQTIDNDEPFTEYLSRRTIKRRRKQSPPQQQQQSGNEQRRDGGQRQDVRRPAKQILVGKAASTGVGLAAAKKITKKAVFCIDNIDPSFDASDLHAFVSSLSVNVVSCFRVAPRRRRNETPRDVADRRAFRLCVEESDRDRLLDADKWPDSVKISQWYYIPPTDERRQRADVRRDGRDVISTAQITTGASVTAVASVAAAAAAVPASPNAETLSTDLTTPAEMDQCATDINDTTILYQDAASSTAVV